MKLADYLRQTKTDQVAFAQLVGVDAFSVSRYVTGRRRPSWRLLHKIRDVTGGLVTANDFMDPPGDAARNVAASSELTDPRAGCRVGT